MLLTSKIRTSPSKAASPAFWDAALGWLVRPLHHRAVHALRNAIEQSDPERLASFLDPCVSVVVDSGNAEHPTIRVVNGVRDAVALLLYGMASGPGRAIVERSVNGQAGLVLERDERAEAAVAVDYTGRLVSMVWIRLQPRMQRHWNAV